MYCWDSALSVTLWHRIYTGVCMHKECNSHGRGDPCMDEVQQM